MAAIQQEFAPATRLPPHSMEAEQSVLGGLLLNNNRWDEMGDVLRADYFYARNHQTIFTAIQTLLQSGTPADVITVCNFLDTKGQLEQVGGLAYVGALAQNTPTSANIDAYSKIVVEHAVLRKLITTCEDIARRAYSTEGSSSDEVVDRAEQNIMEVSESVKRQGDGFTQVREYLNPIIEHIEERAKSSDPITGVATGFSEFDGMTAGLQRSDLIIVAARPSMGKTSLAMNIVEYAAIERQVPVAVFSLEMSGEQLTTRMIASLGRVSAHRMRTGKLTDDDWPRVTSAMTMLQAAPIFVDDTSAVSAMELRAKCRRLKREHGLGLIVIDYLQLMEVSDSDNRATAISEVTRNLKVMARELDVPVVALSQLNRSLENRPNKRPIMSDLRESGAIEQDADLIIFIYRDEVYDEDSKDKGLAEIIIGKQRNGPIGTVRMTFLKDITRFENYSPDNFADNRDGGGW